MQNYIVFIKTPSIAIVQASTPKAAEKKYRKIHTSNPETEVVVVPWSFAKVNGEQIWKYKGQIEHLGIPRDEVN